jgi:hypothetical protein
MPENTTHRTIKKPVTPRIYDLKQHKINEEYGNLRYVLHAVKELGSATTGEILMQVNKEAEDDNRALKNEAQRLYGTRDDMLTSRQLNNYVNERKRNTVGIRTVQRAVETLLRYGLIHKHASRHYSLSSKTSKEIRYFPHDFADEASFSVFLLRVVTVEQSMEEMITRFGAYIFYTFIEAARPPMTREASNSTGILDREKLLDSWLKNAIPIKKMFDWFVRIYTIRNSTSSWERNEKIIDKLTHVLECKYPEIYKIFKEAKLDVLGELEQTMEQRMKVIENLRKVKLLKPGQKMEWPYPSGGRVSADVAPSDWNEQLTS